MILTTNVVKITPIIAYTTKSAGFVSMGKTLYKEAFFFTPEHALFVPALSHPGVNALRPHVVGLDVANTGTV